MGTQWSSTTKYIVGVGLVLAGAVVLYISRAVLGMVTAAFILAFITYPVVRFLNTRLRFPRGLAAITAYLLLGLVLALIPIIITPIAVDAVRAIKVDAFVDWLQTQAGGVEAWLSSIRTVQAFGIRLSLAPIVDPILDTLAGTAPNDLPSLERLLDLIPTAFGSVTSVARFLATTISSVAFAIFLTVIIAVYLSIDAGRFHEGVIDLAPAAYQEEFRALLDKIGHVWSAFFRGQITVSLILALITWLGATAVGLPGAFILGLTAGVLALIPSLGPILALIPAVVVALVQGTTSPYLNSLNISNMTFAVIVLGLYFLIQQLEGNIITPRIVGQAIDLPPVAVVLGVVIGTSVAGLAGAVLAAPVVATGRVLATYAWNKIIDREPFYQFTPTAPPFVRPPARTVRWIHLQVQHRYPQLSSMARAWPGDEEE
jgi:predicted PurR-regulated permease PerM